MSYNLTETHKDVLRWLVQEVRAGRLHEEFLIAWTRSGPVILNYKDELPDIGRGSIEALAMAGLLIARPEGRWRDLHCTLLGQAFDAVDSNFQMPERDQLAHINLHGPVTLFDQHGQNVNYQYNAAGNINFGMVQNQIDLVDQLEALKTEIRKAGEANAIDGELVIDADYQVTKAITQAKKPEPDKKTLVDHLNTAKTLMESATTAAGLVGGIVTAIEAVQKIWP